MEVIRANGATDPAYCHEPMVMLMAGRAAEEPVLGSPSAGAGERDGSDLALATDLVKDVELRFDFGELGPVFLADGHDDPLLTVPGLLASVSRRIDRARRTRLLCSTKTEGRLPAFSALFELTELLSSQNTCGCIN